MVVILQDPYNLAGLRACVTGAAGGIGSAIAEALGAHGCIVTILDRDESRLLPTAKRLTALGLDVTAQVCDLSEFAAIRGIVEAVAPIDILVNNAAVYPRAYLDSVSPDHLRKVFDVNTFAAIELARHASKSMVEREYGRIVNITSITTSGAWTGMTAYAASKGALAAASRIAAQELGTHRITVNCVAPGAIPTDAEPADTRDADVLAHQALPFRGTPADVAQAVVFLASPAAQFITGQTIRVDGGWR